MQSERLDLERLWKDGYQLLNVPQGVCQSELERRKGTCHDAFLRFEGIRGKVVGLAITVESQLAGVLADYFCPVIQERENGTIAIEFFGPTTFRRFELIDYVLMRQHCSFADKKNILSDLLDSIDTSVPSSCKKIDTKKVCNSLEWINTTRNKLAHRPVGIDFQTTQVSLWLAKLRNWEKIDPTLEDKYKVDVETARRLLTEVHAEVSRLQREGDPRHAIPIK